MLKFNLVKASIPIWSVALLFLTAVLVYKGGPPLTILRQSSVPSHSNSPGPARQIAASVLLERPPPEDVTSIPKLFHQSWSSTELPAKFQAWSMSCRTLHPNWEWVLWTDEDNLNLVRKYFPWLEESYLAMPGEIYRADLARSLYMYIYGGLVRPFFSFAGCLPNSVVACSFNIRSKGAETLGRDANKRGDKKCICRSRHGMPSAIGSSLRRIQASSAIRAWESVFRAYG